jgi:two-component system sensor histidine kinase TctE
VTYSIKQRLLSSALTVLSVVGLISGLVVWQLSERASDEAYDRVLGAAALSISETIGISDDDVTVDIPYAAFAILGTSGMNRIFYRIVDPKGNLVTGTPVLGIDSLLLQKSGSVFFDSEYRGNKIRVAQIARFHQGNSGGGWFNVFVGETREARNQLATRLTTFALIPAILAIFLGIILIVIAIRSSFSSLHEIEESIRSRNPSDMSPIDDNVPTEVQELIYSINHFMARLDSTLTGLRRVTADAAHQLRTPLTAMRALSELAVDTNPAEPLGDYVRRIHSNAISATELANKLMIEATLLHSIEVGDRSEIDFFDLVKKVVRLVINQLKFQIDLPEIEILNETKGSAIVHGNEIALTELIKNLLENAIKHGEGPIQIGLANTATNVVLRIKDRGPGFPDAIRDRLFERFIKDPDKPTGSGLGLSIVAQVLRASDGTISMLEPSDGGVCVEVSFPRSTMTDKNTITSTNSNKFKSVSKNRNTSN